MVGVRCGLSYPVRSLFSQNNTMLRCTPNTALCPYLLSRSAERWWACDAAVLSCEKPLQNMKALMHAQHSSLPLCIV